MLIQDDTRLLHMLPVTAAALQAGAGPNSMFVQALTELDQAESGAAQLAGSVVPYSGHPGGPSFG